MGIGYIGAPEWIAKSNKMQGQITSSELHGQRATIAAVNAPVSQIQYMVDEFQNEEIIIDLLKAILELKLINLKELFMFFLMYQIISAGL